VELWFETRPMANGLNGLQRFFSEVNGARSAMVPATDLVEDEDNYRFYVEMPGFVAESVEVHAEDDSLVIEAERKRPEWSKDAQLHLNERHYGPVRRAFRLPDNASQDKIRAAYKDGVLEVTVPKRPEAKPLRIKVEHQN
jgi:HSP20 family protein